MVTWENYEEYMLLEADGELDEVGQKELYAFVAQHPELKKELAAYLATQLQPDTQLVFADKESLLKKGGSSRTISLRNMWAYGAAAAVLLMIAVIIIKQGNKDAPMPIAHEQAATPAPERNDSVEELHSKPANPVTIENIANNEPKKQELKEHKEKKQQIIPATPAPKRDEYIAKQTPKPAETIKPTPNIAKPGPMQEEQKMEQIANNEKTQEQPTIAPLPKEEMMAMATPEKEDKQALGWLIRDDKKESANVIAEAVEHKLEKVKSIRNNLKNTDIAFKIGNRELFVVKF